MPLYRALATLRLPSGTIRPGQEFETYHGDVAHLIRTNMVEVVEEDRSNDRPDLAAMIGVLKDELSDARQSLKMMTEVAQAAEDRAKKAEAELDALRSSLPAEPPPSEPPPSELPPPKADKPPKAK